jgi:hypothetical protein
MSKNTYQPDTYFVHKYGGIYQTSSRLSRDDGRREIVTYTHIYPFEANLYSRLHSEWTDDRFRPITTEQMGGYIALNPRKVTQDLIKLRKLDNEVAGFFLSVGR